MIAGARIIFCLSLFLVLVAGQVEKDVSEHQPNTLIRSTKSVSRKAKVQITAAGLTEVHSADQEKPTTPQAKRQATQPAPQACRSCTSMTVEGMGADDGHWNGCYDKQPGVSTFIKAGGEKFIWCESDSAVGRHQKEHDNGRWQMGTDPLSGTDPSFVYDYVGCCKEPEGRWGQFPKRGEAAHNVGIICSADPCASPVGDAGGETIDEMATEEAAGMGDDAEGADGNTVAATGTTVDEMPQDEEATATPVSCRNAKSRFDDTANPKRMNLVKNAALENVYCVDLTADTASATGELLTQASLDTCATWSSGSGGFYTSTLPCKETGKAGGK